MSGPSRGQISSDGLDVCFLDWGGDGPALVMLHPNGFCAGSFAPLAERLTDTYRTVAVDLRGHGGSAAPRDYEDLGFGAMAGDVANVLDHLGVGDLYLLGNSMGGGVGIHLAAAVGERMRGLMLCEAIAFPFAQRPSTNSNHMAEAARRRRALWPDRAAMVESYGARPPLRVMQREFLEAYVQWGTVERRDGMVELACPPEIEARCFEQGAEPDSSGKAFDLLAQLDCPVTVLAGDATDLGIDRFEAQALQANVELQTVPGGHFFLQEDLDRAERLVRSVLGG